MKIIFATVAGVSIVIGMTVEYVAPLAFAAALVSTLASLDMIINRS